VVDRAYEICIVRLGVMATSSPRQVMEVAAVSLPRYTSPMHTVALTKRSGRLLCTPRPFPRYEIKSLMHISILSSFTHCIVFETDGYRKKNISYFSYTKLRVVCILHSLSSRHSSLSMAPILLPSFRKAPSARRGQLLD
jgi:hypothetical protein